MSFVSSLSSRKKLRYNPDSEIIQYISHVYLQLLRRKEVKYPIYDVEDFQFDQEAVEFSNMLELSRFVRIALKA